MDKKKIFEDLFGDKEKHELGKYIPSNNKKPKSKNQKKEALERRFEKLKHKAIYLKMEHEELVETLQVARSTFISEIIAYCKDKKIKAPLEEIPEEKGSGSGEIKTEETDRLFREIAIRTHPDKNKNLAEDQLSEHKRLFDEAVKAKKEGALGTILKVATDLNIKIKSISPKLVNQLQKEVWKTYEQSQKIKNDIMFKWYKSGDKLKKSIFEALTSGPNNKD